MRKKESAKFILERLYIATEIPFHVYGMDENIIMQTGPKDIKNDPFYTDENLWSEIREKNESKQKPTLYIEDDVFIYGSFFDDEGNYYISGPTTLATPSVSKMHFYTKRHGVGKEKFFIPVKNYMTLANLLAMAYWGITGRQVIEEMILTDTAELVNVSRVEIEDMDKYHFEKSEHDVQHLSYQYEQQYLSAVERGDVDYSKEIYAADPKAIDKIGKLADDSFKQLEYMCLSSIVLVTRASMRGGLNPSKAYALSELYMQKLEYCKNTQEILNLNETMRVDFITRVKNEKERKVNKDYIEKCKDYIAQNVHYPIKIREIADIIGVNHSYLSRKFSEQENITIARYNIKVRLQAAANMLKYSEASIAQVSDYFCFASQSRFGSQFKEEFGVTPSVYRKENQVIDFMSKK